MEENLGSIESRVQEIYDYQLDSAFIKDKLIDVEDRLKRNNLRLAGIKEGPNETEEDCRKNLYNFLRKV